MGIYHHYFRELPLSWKVEKRGREIIKSEDKVCHSTFLLDSHPSPPACSLTRNTSNSLLLPTHTSVFPDVSGHCCHSQWTCLATSKCTVACSTCQQHFVTSARSMQFQQNMHSTSRAQQEQLCVPGVPASEKNSVSPTFRNTSGTYVLYLSTISVTGEEFWIAVIGPSWPSYYCEILCAESSHTEAI